MSRKKGNKFIVNTVLILTAAGIIAKILPYFIAVFAFFYLINFWLARKK